MDLVISRFFFLDTVGGGRWRKHVVDVLLLRWGPCIAVASVGEFVGE